MSDNPSGSDRTPGGDSGDAQRPSAPRSSSGLRSGMGHIVTLGGLGRNVAGSGGNSGRSNDDDSEDDEDSDDGPGERWFAGGERSGISIENPGNNRSVPGGNTVKEILRRAALAGPPPAAVLSSAVFRGGGHTLGSDEVESTYIPDPDAQDNTETAIRHLTFWRNGFQVEDGDLMRYDDPEHANTLAEINSGLAPPSILNVQTGQRVDLRVARRTEEDYVPPKTKKFGGTGNVLGGIVPGDSNTTGGSVPMPGAFPTGNRSGPRAPSEGIKASFATRFEVDQSQPTTSIQIRLADGTRMVARMNLTHTVGDIRNYINASRPENLARPYVVMTTFPNRTLDDDSATIQGSGLVNSVIVQRWA